MALTGHLRLRCAADAEGRTYLREQSFRAPIHLSKPHLDAGALVVNVVNPTAGLLSGDRIVCEVAVEAGARVLLTAPSASRAHRAPHGRAELRQDFRIAAGGSLDCWPELFIPQGGARYRQETKIAVDRGGELLFFETLAPGRVAMGEAFAFDELSWETELRVGGELAARERYELSAGSVAIEAMRRAFPTAYYGSCLVVSPHLGPEASCWPAIHALHRENAWTGCSPLRCGGFVVKILAADAVRFRKQCEAVRREIYRALGRPEPSLRRSSATPVAA